MAKLDTQALKILYLLDSSPRMPLVAISKALRLPEATVRYRIRTMEEAGVIRQAYPIFDVGRIGMSVHKFMFKLLKTGEPQIEKFTSYIAQNPMVNWVARFDGHFDIGCTLLVRHVGEVSAFLDAIRKRFHANLKQLSYAVNIHAEFFPRDYLVRSQRRDSTGSAYRSFAEKGDRIDVDRTDWDVIQALADDARATSATIAQKIGVSSETVARRIKRLEQVQFVTGYRLVLEHRQLERTSYYMLLHLNFVSAEKIDKLLLYLRSRSTVVYIIKMLGEWDYDISVELADVTSHRTFVVELMTLFSEVIRDLQTLTTWEIVKHSIFPTSTFIPYRVEGS